MDCYSLLLRTFGSTAMTLRVRTYLLESSFSFGCQLHSLLYLGAVISILMIVLSVEEHYNTIFFFQLQKQHVFRLSIQHSKARSIFDAS